jgi:hypothetical protein
VCLSFGISRLLIECLSKQGNLLYPSLDQYSQMKTTNSIPGFPYLYRRRVQHDADGGTEGLAGKRRRELGADDARVAVRPGDLAPDHADLGTADLLLAAVDVGDLLAAVEVGAVGVVDTLDLDQAGAGGGVVAGALIAQVTSLDV